MTGHLPSVGDFRGLLPVISSREAEPALMDAGGAVVWTRAQLRERCRLWSTRFESPKRGLVLLACQNEPETIAALVGAIGAGHAVALIDGATSPGVLAGLILAFAPEFIVWPRPGPAIEGGYEAPAIDSPLTLLAQPTGDADEVWPDLAILLSTSGTTGSSKFVRLSIGAITANADQIIEALSITPDSVAAAHLPIHYSYGMSVVTSHLRRGAAVHLLESAVTTPEFWSALRRSGATHFPGVPFHYDFLARGDPSTLLGPGLRNFTQAGGALAPRIAARLHEKLGAIGGKLFLMYGQTEASPRITTLPAERLADKMGSVGKALRGGRLSILDAEDRPLAAGEVGRIIYEGPNVMLGYAERRADLALGDVSAGRLETGDLGRLDDEGYLTITGRATRFAKLYGMRIGLDEVESRFSALAEVAAVDGGEKILLFTPDPDAVRTAVSLVATEYKLMAANFVIRPVSVMPRKANGKVDYARLEVT